MREIDEKICRLCLSGEGFLLNIFQDQYMQNSVSLRFKILTCADIEIFADDNLPTVICHNCLHQVEKAYKFRNKCEKSDAALRAKLDYNEPGAEKLTFSLDDDNSQTNLKLEDDLNGWNFTETTKFDDLNNCVFNYNCMGCSAHFDSHTLFIDHFKIEHPTVPILECRSCNYPALTGTELKRHFHETHEVCYSCKSCEKVFKTVNTYEKHKLQHEETKINCKDCKQVFYSQRAFKQHESYHIDKFCKYCCIEFTSKLEFDQHVQSCKKLYSCNFCEKEFTFKKDIMEHIIESHKNPQLTRCEFCLKTFQFYNQLQEHKCEKQMTKSSSCETTCDSSSSVSQNDVYKCKFCSKKFNVKGSLRRHEKSHSGVKPFQCKYCPKRFKDNSTCIVHLRTHTGETPFQCVECHKNFRQLANLKMHTYRHHKKTLNLNQIHQELNNIKTIDNTTELEPSDQLAMYDYSLEASRVYQTLPLSVPTPFDHQLGNT